MTAEFRNINNTIDTYQVLKSSTNTSHLIKHIF